MNADKLIITKQPALQCNNISAVTGFPDNPSNSIIIHPQII